jgi:hypothetical protein
MSFKELLISYAPDQTLIKQNIEVLSIQVSINNFR